MAALLLLLLLPPLLHSVSLSDSCPSPAVLLSTSLSCASCPALQTRLNSTFCACQSNYISSDKMTIGYKSTCAECPTDTVKSRTLPNQCQKCPNGIDSST